MNADGSEVTQITNSITKKRHPAWSPDGTKIAFSALNESEEGAYIYIMNTDGSDIMQIPDPNNSAVDPSWSPDGKQIVYYSNLDIGGADFEIFTMNVDGSGRKRLTFDTTFNVDPAWSPNGSRIAFAAGSKGAAPLFIHLMNPDGTRLQQLTTGDKKNQDSGPDWSPDGSQIVFTHCDLGNYCGISMMNADGSNEVELTNEASPGLYDAYPAWQP